MYVVLRPSYFSPSISAVANSF